MSEPVKLPRTVRGKRPEFFETPGVDDALSMVMVVVMAPFLPFFLPFSMPFLLP